MPLLKRKPFSLLEPPQDLKPRELVFQVRFTKEIFRDYHDYLNRMNLYRQRLWTCKMTGKSNLTYEEALVSENRATEKVKQFPGELITPVLRTVQFSMLPLRDLVHAITAELQERSLEGVELHGRKDDGVHLCKVLKVLEKGGRTQYEVAWLDKDRQSTGVTVVNGEDFIRKKLPFTRELLKSFIRESTCSSVPWLLHDKLARKHGISTNPPEELKGKVFLKDGLIVRNRKRKNNEVIKEGLQRCKGTKLEKETPKEYDQLTEEPIKYPIDDLLVQPGSDDPIFTEPPSPSRDFSVPTHCVGELLMAWDFCCSFGRLLQLSPFSLEDFENAICHKDSNSILVVECQMAFLRLLINDGGQYFSAIHERKQKSKITLVNWAEYLCDFIEMIDIPKLRACITTIRRGHYCLIDTSVKLQIFEELVEQVIATDIFREKVDEYVEQRQVLGATRRGEALDEAKKRREDKEHLKLESDSNHLVDKHSIESTGSNLHLANKNHNRQNGHVAGKRNGVVSSQRNHASENRKHVNSSSKKLAKHKTDVNVAEEKDKDQSRKESHKMTLQQDRHDRTGVSTKRNGKQRKEYYEREMEKRIIRTNPLGKDKNYNRYWWFRRDGRIFVESSDSKLWGYYSTKEELDAFMGSLNRKGVRERALHKQLENCYDRICSELQKRSNNEAQKMDEAVVRRSSRVRAPPRESPAFLTYVNKWRTVQSSNNL